MSAKSIAVLAAVISGLALAETPDKFVRYVESTGSQYVDTGVTGRWNTKVEAQVEWLEFKDSSLIGSRTSSSSPNANSRLYLCYTYKHGSESSLNVIYTATNGVLAEVYYNSAAARWETNRIYDYSATLSATNDVGQTTTTINVDGLEIFNKSAPALDTGRTLHLFACNVAGTASYFSKARIYRVKIWQGPKDGGDMTLQRDLIPCMKNGRPGLYDTMSGDILYSGASTDLVCDENSEVPDEYVEYVESTGLNFIDTEIEARSGTEAEIDLEILNRRSLDKGILEAYNGSLGNNNARYYLAHSYLGTVTCGYGLHKTTGANYTVGQRYYITSSLATGAQTLTMAAHGSATTNTIHSAADATAIDTGLPLYLFACNKDGNIDYGGQYRLYGLKIRQDGTLVRDFKPCLKDGEFALYDDVSKRIFHAKRGLLNGPLQATPVKTKNLIFVDYIESDGTIFVDTCVEGRSGTKADAKLQFKEKADKGFLDSRKGDSRFYLIHNGANNNVFYIGYGKAQSFSPCAVSTDYTVQSELSVGKQEVTVNGETKWTTGQSTTYINPSDNIDTGYNLYLFAMNQNGSPTYAGAARLYYLKLYQGDSDGSNMKLVRNLKPVRLSNDVVVLWDFVEKKAYRPQLVSSPGTYTTFSSVGADGEAIRDGLMIVVR